MSRNTLPGAQSMLALAIGIAGLVATSAVGQSALNQPAELPPAGFTGNEFVDSSGCIFVRAGVTGATTWVPRVTQNRQQSCGFEPSFPTARANTQAAPTVVRAADPTEAEPEATKTVAAAASVAPVAAPAPQKSPPKPRVKQARAPAKPAMQVEPRFLPAHIAEARKGMRPVRVPKGYKSAWQDGRLNPKRAEQTATGQAQMRAIWTDTVPRRLIEP